MLQLIKLKVHLVTSKYLEVTEKYKQKVSIKGKYT